MRNPDSSPEVCPETAWVTAAQIEGWLTREEADLLYRYARSPWCEIGTYKGRSAAVLMSRGRGWCVDTFQASSVNDVRKNIGWTGYELIEGDQGDVVDKVPDALQFLYLDADHTYVGTHEAFDLYGPKVVVGGHVALHDALELHPGQMEWPEVREFMLDLILRPDWRLVAAAHRVVVFKRLQ